MMDPRETHTINAKVNKLVDSGQQASIDVKETLRKIRQAETEASQERLRAKMKRSPFWQVWHAIFG